MTNGRRPSGPPNRIVTEGTVPLAPPTVTYFAISILSSRTAWLNFAALFVAVCSLTEVITIVPPRLMPLYSAAVAIANLVLRFVTVRPVALIAPGSSKPVEVTKIDPPAPPIISD